MTAMPTRLSTQTSRALSARASQRGSTTGRFARAVTASAVGGERVSLPNDNRTPGAAGGVRVAGFPGLGVKGVLPGDLCVIVVS
jgi:hypothetical protein